MKLAGLKINEIRKLYNYTDKELLTIFKKEISRMGLINQHEFDKLKEKGTPSIGFYRYHFNCTWIDLLLKIGYTDDDLKYIKYSKEELIKILQDLYKKLGHTPSLTDLNENGYSETQFKNKVGIMQL
ncbi:hypothetical protein CbC4_7012 (plasmid) [Clostridium botulinum BKT015925]|nr:hypothetical protein [Clostridium botulinum]AEB77623.1 hypothetical protein CbC4_7012 [Clostridium botulinum BKT015925]